MSEIIIIILILYIAFREFLNYKQIKELQSIVLKREGLMEEELEEEEESKERSDLVSFDEVEPEQLLKAIVDEQNK